MQIVDIQHLPIFPNGQQQYIETEMIGNVEIQIGGIYYVVMHENPYDLGNVPSMNIDFHWEVFLSGKGRWDVDV